MFSAFFYHPEIVFEESLLPVVIPVEKPIPEIMKKISWCESKNLQFEADGTVHRGVINPKDVGKYQINEYYHLEASQALKMDIYTLSGNTEYALYLYGREGTTPWNWSKGCWGDQTISSEIWQLRFKENIE